MPALCQLPGLKHAAIISLMRQQKMEMFMVPCGTETEQNPPKCPKPCPVAPLCRHAPNCKPHRCNYGACPLCGNHYCMYVCHPLKEHSSRIDESCEVCNLLCEKEVSELYALMPKDMSSQFLPIS
ncbi:NF-X1-type zinc finger protein NFXL2 [Perilla frutescens var. hirtella]|uniref:NF-X1-type zinc finger protein NFXL2 n=1 Tax=Perilla frutescens var. hirtella TaxID=608512 RepID=A0AAD4IQA9_PERFH|nr:NF-X1-type zinc finger protein NFXL2 [Perilla frutescens var. hirtella]